MTVTLITGANKGIGFETAAQLVEKGHIVYLGARDIRRGSAAAAAEGHLDVLINNAGIGELTLDGPTALRVFDTNAVGIVRVTEAALPLLRRAAAPAVVTISSSAGSFWATTNPDRPEFHLRSALYSASKAAASMLTLQYAKAHPDIRFTALEPGYTATDLTAAFGGGRLAEQSARVVVRVATTGPEAPSGILLDEDGELPGERHDHRYTHGAAHLGELAGRRLARTRDLRHRHVGVPARKPPVPDRRRSRHHHRRRRPERHDDGRGRRPHGLADLGRAAAHRSATRHPRAHTARRRLRRPRRARTKPVRAAGRAPVARHRARRLLGPGDRRRSAPRGRRSPRARPDDRQWRHRGRNRRRGAAWRLAGGGLGLARCLRARCFRRHCRAHRADCDAAAHHPARDERPARPRRHAPLRDRPRGTGRDPFHHGRSLRRVHLYPPNCRGALRRLHRRDRAHAAHLRQRDRARHPHRRAARRPRAAGGSPPLPGHGRVWDAGTPDGRRHSRRPDRGRRPLGLRLRWRADLAADMGALTQPTRLEQISGLLVVMFTIAIAAGAVVGGILVDGISPAALLLVGGIPPIVGGLLIAAFRRAEVSA